MAKRKTYRELSELCSFLDRFEYLKLRGSVGKETFGSFRYLNQAFYQSLEWRSFRNSIIIRDNGCDLGVPGREIKGRLIIHHINPITDDEIYHASDSLMDPDNVICVSFVTHNAIHYGDTGLLYPDPIERRPYDTCPWKGGSACPRI